MADLRREVCEMLEEAPDVERWQPKAGDSLEGDCDVGGTWVMTADGAEGYWGEDGGLRWLHGPSAVLAKGARHGKPLSASDARAAKPAALVLRMTERDFRLVPSLSLDDQAAMLTHPVLGHELTIEVCSRVEPASGMPGESPNGCGLEKR